jgi:hypothetical protein
MTPLSFARIMYGSSEGMRGGSGLSALGTTSRPALPVTSSSMATEAHVPLTLESLLQKAWRVLSSKRWSKPSE